jgi:restriction system protein
MAVPDYQTLMLPLLKALGGGEVRRLFPEVGDQVAGEFGLTEEDLEQMLPSGATTTYRNRLHWAATYMVKAGLITRPERGRLRIAERGEDVLAERPAKIDNTLLSRFPEFVAFKAKRNARVEKLAPDDEENPEESLYSAYGSWRATIEADLLTSLQSDAFHWADFERLVVDLLHAMGYGRGDEDRKRVTKMTGDHGIDGVIDEDRLGLDAVYRRSKHELTTDGAA